jgi:small subunit ribosomal protein S17
MKTLQGKVVSDKMQKTVVVAVERFMAHPRYHKRIRRTNKFHAHDEIGVSRGDEVKIVEISPVAKTVTWKVSEIVKKHAPA